MSWISDIEKVGKGALTAVEALPIVGSGIALPAAGIQAATGDSKGATQSLINAIPGLGSLNAYTSLAKQIGQGAGIGQPSQPSSTSDQSQFETDLGKLTYGQENNPNQQLLSQLSQLLGQMSPSQAASVLGNKNLKGTTLESELQSVAGGESPQQVISAHQQAINPGAASQQQAAYTDVMANILGNVFQNTIEPFTKQINASSNAQENSDISAMEGALKGASPQMQSAMAGIPQELKATNDMLQTAGNQAMATAPEYSQLISSLGNAMNQYKAAQQALGVYPYYQAALSGQALPSTIGGVGVNPATGLLQPPAA